MAENEIVNVLPEDLPNNPEPNAYEPALNIAGRVKIMRTPVDPGAGFAPIPGQNAGEQGNT